MIESFASEYHEMKERCSNVKGRQSLPFVRIRPWPQQLTKADKPDVIYWTKDDFQKAQKAEPKGETDANVATIAQKNKVGHPPKLTSNEDHMHIYMEKEDGTHIEALALRLPRVKACENWKALVAYDIAPKSWGQISSVAWEFYAQAMLNKPGLEFLCLCNDSQWKLREWTTHNYSRWAVRQGV